MDDIVALVRSERLSQGLSIRRLAVLSGVSFATLARLERGEYHPDERTKVSLERWLSGTSKTRSMWEADVEHRLSHVESVLSGLPSSATVASGVPHQEESDMPRGVYPRKGTVAKKKSPVKAAAKKVAARTKLKGAKKGGKKGGKRTGKGPKMAAC